MATNFPTSLDDIQDPLATSKQGTFDHAGLHTDENDAIEAVQAKVGVDGSAVTTSLDYKLNNTVGGHNHDGINSREIDYPQFDHAELSNLDFANSGHSGFQSELGYTAENSANKSTDGTFASNSDTLYPSQKAAKTYVDTQDATKISKATNVTSINDTGIADGEIAVFDLTNKEIKTSNKTIVTTLGTDDTTVPTSKAVKDVTDAISNINYIWQGPWTITTAYAENDLVENDGSAYICTNAHTSASSTEPGTGVDWNNEWDLMVQKGSNANITTKCRAYLSGSQLNITDATDTKVLLDAESYDIGGDFDTTNSRFVAPVTGYYMVTGTVGFQNVITDKQYQAMIFVNGAATCFSLMVPGAALAIRINISDIVYVVAGQYIELYCRQNSGASTPDLISSSTSTNLAIHLLSI